MRFAQVLAFAGLALAGKPVYVTEVVTETASVETTSTTSTPTWKTYYETVTVTLPEPETTIPAPVNCTTAWSNGTHPVPTGKKPSGGDKPGHTEVPVVTAGASSSKASFALLGLAGAAMLIL